jgi:methylenetetrahydrofolate dehydrogenase (NADP+)/methenyltetrahydrofolate cyclohydrolase
MGYQLLDGTDVASQMKAEMAREVAQRTAQGLPPPHLAAILVGHDGASETYVAAKVRACEQIGFRSSLIRFASDVPQSLLLDKIQELNRDRAVDGFIVQLPLPPHLDANQVIEAIDHRKDVDGFHPLNAGRLSLGLPAFLPATPAGILELLQRYRIHTQGKHCVVLGRSNIVGKPVASLLLRKAEPGDCTVTVCHSRSRNLPEICRTADLLIVSLGVPGFVRGEMVKQGAVVIDVGITRLPDPDSPKGYRLRGDVCFEEVAPRSAFITPVPGGVGPMTIAALMHNTLLAAAKAVYP